jgi:hypothetical protein
MANPNLQRTMMTTKGPVVEGVNLREAEESANPVALAPKTMPVVSAKKASDDLVTITTFQRLESLNVGKWHMEEELHVPYLEKLKPYKVPRFVANIVVAAKKGAIIE